MTTPKMTVSGTPALRKREGTTTDSRLGYAIAAGVIIGIVLGAISGSLTLAIGMSAGFGIVLALIADGDYGDRSVRH